MRSLSKNYAVIGIIIILIFSTVMTVFAAVSTNFEEFAWGTPASSLTVPGVSFDAPGYIIADAGLSGFTNLSGKFLTGEVYLGALTMNFSSPQSRIGFDFVTGDAALIMTLRLNGDVVDTRTFNGTPISYWDYEGSVMVTAEFNQVTLQSNNSEGCGTGCVAIDNLFITDSLIDNRLNQGYGDANIAIVYPGNDAVDVYSYATGSYIANFITAEDIPDTPPAQNTVIRQEGNIMASILTTGEIQFNLGPDAEGKSYVFIMGDIYGSDRYGSKYDPNE